MHQVYVPSICNMQNCQFGQYKQVHCSIRNSIFSGTEQFFPGTQSFASPPDMASSGVWENIILCKTPTLDGVCGKFSYIK